MVHGLSEYQGIEHTEEQAMMAKEHYGAKNGVQEGAGPEGKVEEDREAETSEDESEYGIMRKDAKTLVPTAMATTSDMLRVVTGRKAARSLRLFCGDGNRTIETLIDRPSTDTDNKPQERVHGASISEDTTQNKETKAFKVRVSPDQKSPAAGCDTSQIEPVSSATYFPHTPADQKYIQNSIIDTTIKPTKTRHLTADLEFDHSKDGDITKIQKHGSTHSDENEKLLEQLEAVDIDKKLDKHKSVTFGTSQFYDASAKLQEQTAYAITQEHDSEKDEEESWNDLTLGEEEFPLAVELRPFKNKVGGHTAIFRFSRKAVCKALMNRENIWYEAVELRHPELLQFMPKYIGVLNVRYSSLITEDPISQNTSRNNSLVEEGMSHRKKDCNFGGHSIIEDDEFPPEVVLDDNKHIIPELLWKQYSASAPSPNGSLIQNLNSGYSLDASSLKNSVSSSSTSMSNFVMPASPRNNEAWSTSVNTDLQVQVIQEVFSSSHKKKKSDAGDDIFMMDDESAIADVDSHELAKDDDEVKERRQVAARRSSSISSLRHSGQLIRKHTRFERFILLEDLTADMHKPCVLDLKMGTRQYGIEANPAKQKSQRNKCLNTTSRRLGVRVCGLQVWNTKQESYFVRDKYFGRKVTEGLDFSKVLAKFLYDGKLIYSILAKIPTLILQLQELYEIFKTLTDYRMYGSSILLMYDGMDTKSDIKVRIIDFAQSVIAEESLPKSCTIPPQNQGLPDMGYLRGLNSLISYFKTIFRLLSGSDYTKYEEAKKEIESRKDELLQIANQWLEKYDDANTGSDAMDDQFEQEYPRYLDEDGISE